MCHNPAVWLTSPTVCQKTICWLSVFEIQPLEQTLHSRWTLPLPMPVTVHSIKSEVYSASSAEKQYGKYICTAGASHTLIQNSHPPEVVPLEHTWSLQDADSFECISDRQKCSHGVKASTDSSKLSECHDSCLDMSVNYFWGVQETLRSLLLGRDCWKGSWAIKPSYLPTDSCNLDRLSCLSLKTSYVSCPVFPSAPALPLISSLNLFKLTLHPLVQLTSVL